MKMLRLNRLAFVVRDIEASLGFYHNLLGLACRQRTPVAVLGFGDCEIVLRPPGTGVAQEAANSAALGSQNFCFRAQGDADRLLAHLSAQGAHLVERKVAVREGALGEMHSVYIFDPDYNLVEIGIYQATEQPFQITALDHVVLVVADLVRTMDFYQDTLGMEGTSSCGHGVLHAGTQKFNVHHNKPRYAPHEPYAAIGSVECHLLVDSEVHPAGVTHHGCFRDPDGNSIVFETGCS